MVKIKRFLALSSLALISNMGTVQAAQKATPSGQAKMNPEHLLTNVVTVVKNSMERHEFISAKSDWSEVLSLSMKADELFLSLQKRFDEFKQGVSEKQIQTFLFACILLCCILPAKFKLWTLKAIAFSIIFFWRMRMMGHVAEAAVNYLAGKNVYHKNAAYSIIFVTYFFVRRMISWKLAIPSALCSYMYIVPMITNA